MAGGRGRGDPQPGAARPVRSPGGSASSSASQMVSSTILVLRVDQGRFSGGDMKGRRVEFAPPLSEKRGAGHSPSPPSTGPAAAAHGVLALGAEQRPYLSRGARPRYPHRGPTTATSCCEISCSWSGVATASGGRGLRPRRWPAGLTTCTAAPILGGVGAGGGGANGRVAGEVTRLSSRGLRARNSGERTGGRVLKKTVG